MEQIGGAIIGGLMGGDDSSSSQTQTREPWGPAQDWLRANITQGQELQNRYMSNPFSQQQQNAFSNAFGMSDAYRQMMPQLIQGLNSGSFDRTNPLSRPKGMEFGGFSPSMTNIGNFRVQEAAPKPTEPDAAAADAAFLRQKAPNLPFILRRLIK